MSLNCGIYGTIINNDMNNDIGFAQTIPSLHKNNPEINLQELFEQRINE
jgi:hypothetical protein